MKITSKIYLSLFPCTLWKGIAENAVEYCRKGDLLGIKGNLRTRKIEQEETVHNVVEVVAEKVTYLTSRSKKEADE